MVYIKSLVEECKAKIVYYDIVKLNNNDIKEYLRSSKFIYKPEDLESDIFKAAEKGKLSSDIFNILLNQNV